MHFSDYTRVLDVMADAVIASDRTDRVLYVNAAAERLLGWGRDELVGKPLTTLMPERMRPLHEAGFRRYTTTGQTRIMGRPVRVPALRRDQSEIDIELTLSSIRLGADGEVILASLRDLRDRVELERQLLAQQRLAAQNAVMAVFAETDDMRAATVGMLRAVGESLHWPLANYWEVTATGRLERTAAWDDGSLDAAAMTMLTADVSFAAGEGLPGRVLDSSAPAWIADLGEDTNFPRLHAALLARLRGAFAFPIFVEGRVAAVAEFFSPVPHKIDEELLATAQTLGRQVGQFIERMKAHHGMQRAAARARFLADASNTLASSIDYEATLRRVAELAVPTIADWCTVVALDQQRRFRRIAVVHRDPSKRDAVVEYLQSFPPTEHRAGRHSDVLKDGKPILQRRVSDADLQAAAQDADHLRVLRALGCASCIMVPLAVRGEPVGVISLMRCGSDVPFDDDDVSVAEQLAQRAAVAIDNARLFSAIEKREASTRFLSEASVVLNSSLDYEQTFKQLTRLAVPRFADWCSVEMLDGDDIRQVAVAHVDPAKVSVADEIRRRYPVSLSEATGTPRVIRTGEPELYEEIPDELLVQGTRDGEHLRLARELGLRSAVVVPLKTKERTLGALTLVWAESNRRYSRDDLPLLEELGRRAALAVENARLYAEAQRAVKVRDEFLSIASHELKTPLTGIHLQIGGIQRLVKKAASLPPEAQRIVQRIESIERNFDRLNQLVEDLLDVSRASSGHLQLNLEEVDLAEVVREVVARFRDQVARAGCALSVRVDAGIRGRWDRMRLDQVLTNFLSNAIKYAPGKPIEVSARAEGEKAVLSVRDHGIGIGPADRERIFDRFTRAVPSEHYGGLGLGLWIVRLCVEGMGGTVRVQSDPGDGAIFTVELPRDGALAA